MLADADRHIRKMKTPSHEHHCPAAILALCLLSLLASARTLAAGTLSIRNETLIASYNDVSNTFLLTERSARGLPQGRHAPGRCRQGQGRVSQRSGVQVRQAHRGVTCRRRLRVARSLPQPAIPPVGGELRNDTPAVTEVTMGTAGLTAPDKNPGSYLFLTCADPGTRRGVVAGWVTQDRGSGVLFSGVKDGRVEFKAQIDYGHLRIPAGQSATLETLAIGIFDDARIGQELYADAIKRQYAIKLPPPGRRLLHLVCGETRRGRATKNPSVELAGFAAARN